MTLELFLGPGLVSMRKMSHDKWACPRSIYSISVMRMLRVVREIAAEDVLGVCGISVH